MIRIRKELEEYPELTFKIEQTPLCQNQIREYGEYCQVQL